jgi:hypothetical protein
LDPAKTSCAGSSARVEDGEQEEPVLLPAEAIWQHPEITAWKKPPSHERADRIREWRQK